ncbi:MAG: Adenylate kinase [candidate division CPR2 bacterium GW2011_GWC2_39_10]|uniref:Adenylate kinase n=1 Tax=candidate division CPR2 bacterium GW2011_GWC2_39_10 TaxID=1618345 RepID=A0A0G0LND6_UNCC2|nr:MAG: Adenylate kinase [candidate division CPR2 bacterium GW2011_GWC2_39_10]
MRILLSGPPGTGKSAQASLISKKYNIPAVSAGDLLRNEIANKTAIGKKIESYVDKGDLAPDELVDQVVKAKLKKHPEGFKKF